MPRLRKNGQQDGRSSSSAINAIKPVDDPLKVIQAAALAQLGQTQVDIAAQSGLTPGQARYISALSGMEPDKFREAVATRIAGILDLISARLEKEYRFIKVDNLALNIGILIDKYHTLRGISAPSTVNQVNVQINGVDRAAAMALLSNQRSGQAQPMPAPAKPQPKPVHVAEPAPAPDPADATPVVDTQSQDSFPVAQTKQEQEQVIPSLNKSDVAQVVDLQPPCA